MNSYVVWIATISIACFCVIEAAPPIKFSIECEPESEKVKPSPVLGRSRIPILPQSDSPPRSLCEELQRSLPEGVNEGKFVLTDDTEDGLPAASDTQYVVALPPPSDFEPFPQDPTLKPAVDKDENSAERIEKFKKSVDKMAHFVNVLGHLDQYLTDRARHAVNRLSKIVHE